MYEGLGGPHLVSSCGWPLTSRALAVPGGEADEVGPLGLHARDELPVLLLPARPGQARKLGVVALQVVAVYVQVGKRESLKREEEPPGDLVIEHCRYRWWMLKHNEGKSQNVIRH